jgi:hypothetical protein
MVAAMANLTIAIDDPLLREARIKAVQQGTSVNEVCRQAIERFVRGDDAQRVLRAARAQRLLQIAASAQNPGPAPAWPGRDALYGEALRERGLLDAMPSGADEARRL